MIAIGALLAVNAAIAAYLFTKKKQNSKEQPPRNAPQLDLDNPGTQAEFPNSATESEVG